MHRRPSHLLLRPASLLAILLLAGCPTEHRSLGFGESCLPQPRVAATPYVRSETHLELDDTYCASGLCIVHGFEGVPTGDDEEIHCTCRCTAGEPPEGYCSCPGGFECMPMVTGHSYCVREITSRPPDAGVTMP